LCDKMCAWYSEHWTCGVDLLTAREAWQVAG
jgi:hypothetical protein